MAVCPTELAQVADGPPLALFADGLDTAIYRLDPDLLRFRRVSALDGLAGSLAACRSGEVIEALASTCYEPVNVNAGPPAGQLIRLSDTRPALRAIRWGSQERLSYRASDGLGLDGLLVLPPGARVHGSTGGFAMKRPTAEDHRLDQRAPCPPHPGLTASIHRRGCERPHPETTRTLEPAGQQATPGTGHITPLTLGE